MAAVDYFLKLDGIAGESTDDKHKGEINLDSFSWGVSQTAARGGGGGAGTGKAVFQDFHFTMRASKASPQLFLATASGRHIKSAVLVGRKAGGEQTPANEFIKYTFSDVVLDAYGEAGSADVIEDQAAFRYAKVVDTTVGGPLGVTPAALGAIAFDPATGQAEIVAGQPHLAVGSFASSDGGPLLFQRGLAEFDVSNIRPVLGGPGDPHLTLSLTEIREAAITPNTTNIASALTVRSREDQTPKKPKRNRFIVLWYAADDLTLTPADFDRPAHRLGQIVLDPTQPPAELSLDLTRIVDHGHLDRLGIRIQSALDHSGREQDDDGDRGNSDSDDDKSNDEAATPTGATNALFDLSLDLTFG